jgi:hypothetical protein
MNTKQIFAIVMTMAAPGSHANATTFGVGTTTTGLAGSAAKLTLSQTATSVKFNFTIPRGARGLTGATGATGASPFGLYNSNAYFVSGMVGIGTSTPTKAKLEINGTAGSLAYGPRGVFFSDGSTLKQTNTGTYGNASLWASGDIWGGVIFAFSDARIKHIEGRSDAMRDLATLQSIEVTDYTHIDTVTKGAGKQKKVIAQQVEKVFPQAVSRNTDVIPDIYQDATVKGSWVKLATNLKKGERIRLIGKKKEGIHEVLEVTKDSFRTDFVADDDSLFVYGREVKDFRAVDYTAISMLNVSATQELARKLAAKDAELNQLRAANSALGEKLAALEARDEAREARLAKLESSLENNQTYPVNASIDRN